MKKYILVLLALLPCMVFAADTKEIVSPYADAKACVAKIIAPLHLRIGVETIRDKTGKVSMANGGSGKFETDGATDMLYTSLRDMGVEVNEMSSEYRSLVDWYKAKNAGNDLAFPEYAISGGITAMDFSPGVARDFSLAGIGGNDRAYRAHVRLDLRAEALTCTSANQIGEVAASAPVEKDFYAFEKGAGFGRFIGDGKGQTFTELAYQKGEREAIHMATGAAEEFSAIKLLLQIAHKRYGPSIENAMHVCELATRGDDLATWAVKNNGIAIPPPPSPVRMCETPKPEPKPEPKQACTPGPSQKAPGSLPRAVISFSFEDAPSGTYSLAFPEMKKAGFPATAYITGGLMGSEEFLKWSDLKELADAGWEVGAHGYVHEGMTHHDGAWQDGDLSKSIGILRAKGYCPVSSAMVYGELDDSVRSKVSSLFSSHREVAGSPAINALSSFDKYKIHSYPVKGDTRRADIQKLINELKANGGVLVLRFHYVEGELWVKDRNVTHLFPEFVRMVKRSGIPVWTVGQVVDAVSVSAAKK